MAHILEIYRRINTHITLKRAAYGMTLNHIGKLYGVPREKNEGNIHYENRLFRVAVRRGPEIDTKKKSEGKK